MKILYLVPRYWPSVGGAQLLSRELIRRMGRDHTVGVVTQFSSDEDNFIESVVRTRSGLYQDGSVPVYRIGPTDLWRPVLQTLSKLYGHLRLIHPLFAVLLHRAIQPQIQTIIRKNRPDLLHAIHVGLVYSSETACRVASQFQIPFVWTPLPHLESNGWCGTRFLRLYRAANALVAMTQEERKWLIGQGAPAERVRVIPYGPLIHSEFDSEKFRKTYQLGRNPVVLFLGQKLSYKNYQSIIEAAPLVWAKFPEVRFLFIGPRTTESEAFFSKVDDRRVIELPAVDSFEKSSALAACTIFCMPSVQESLGVVYLEAWSFAKPVIAARIRIAREVIEDGKDGFLVEPKPSAIAKAILRLLQGESLIQEMGKAGYQKVQNCYNWNSIIDKTEELYSQLRQHPP